jgi:metallo-beta-lactamase family protein
MKQRSHIIFHGGAGSVTGANFLFDTGERKILIDCGLRQSGERCYVEDNSFAYDPAEIDALIVTHAHADHIGKIPKLVRDGFSGPIYSTAATRDLAAVMLDDALMILTEEADALGCQPLYERADVKRALSMWRTIEYHHPFTIGDGVMVTFHDAGHILGSAMVVCERNERKIVFTGDLGNSPELILPDTEKLTGMHYILMESVYGDRNHEKRRDRTDQLARIIRDNFKRKGTLLIPTFALQRAQVLLYEINKLVENQIVPEMPVYFDAPLGQRVTEIFRRYKHLYNKKVQEEIKRGDDIFDFPQFVNVRNITESVMIRKKGGPKIIIASSGMSNGGRIREHEKKLLKNKNNTMLFIGYQAFGTLGREIQEKKNGVVHIDGQSVRVKARIESIHGYSGHKDSDNLIAFVGSSADTVERIFVAMGEPASSQYLAQALRERYGVDVNVPREDDIVEIDF